MTEINFSYFVDASGNLMGAYDDPLHPEIQDTWIEVDTIPESGSAKYINGSWDMSTPLRADRDNLLLEVDAIAGNALRWAALDADTQAAWATYRQALLDVPQQGGFPNTVAWPVAP